MKKTPVSRRDRIRSMLADVKAKVETGVQIAERWILAPLRNHTFFSLSEANEQIARLLGELHRRPFQKLEGNRRTLFETHRSAGTAAASTHTLQPLADPRTPPR